MTALRAGGSLLLAVVVVALLASLVPPAAIVAAPGTGPTGAASTAAAAPPPSAPGARPPAAAAPAAAPATAAHRSTTACPTPENPPVWNSSSFFQDVLVTVTVPGEMGVSGPDFYTVPCVNEIPEFSSGFYVNVTTDVPITEAFLTIWATTYPTPTEPLPPLANFDPATPPAYPMLVLPGNPDSASFWFNVARFFPPGTNVYFNITMESLVASPTSITSAYSTYEDEVPNGTNDNATWEFEVTPPWWSPTFLNDIAIYTSPPVLSTPQYAPNAQQAFTAEIVSRGPTGAVGPAIPAARMYVHLIGDGYNSEYSDAFGPANATYQNLSNPIGPFPNATLIFNITAYYPWGTQTADAITSPTYSFTWTSQGGWWAPSQGLEANANLTAAPDVLNGSATPLATGTPINVTVHEAIPNVTVTSSVVRFSYSDANGQVAGGLPMSLIGENTTYGLLPGLPNAGRLGFSVLAKDVFGSPVASATYAYTEAGAPAPALGPGENWLFVEAVNITTDVFLTHATYTISNGTWTYTGVTGPLGFGAPLAASGLGYLPLTDGLYHISVTALNRTVATSVSLSGTTPLTVPFWFAHGTVAGTATVPTVAIVAGLVAGPIAAAACLYPLIVWYRERQARAAEEQKRITL